MDNVFWSFVEEAGRICLYLVSEIARAQTWFMDEVTPNLFRSELMGKSGDVYVYFDSPGGDAFAGNSMYDILREYSDQGRGRIIALVSMAASAASIVMMAADEIRLSPVGTVMIHEPWTDKGGNEAELLASAEVLRKCKQRQLDIYAKRTGQPLETVEALMKGTDGRGTFLMGQEAVDYGFADSLIGNDEAMTNATNARIAACAMANNTQMQKRICAKLTENARALADQNAKALAAQAAKEKAQQDREMDAMLMEMMNDMMER